MVLATSQSLDQAPTQTLRQVELDGPQRNGMHRRATVSSPNALQMPLGGTTPAPRHKPRFQLLSPAELQALPPLAWRVRGVLPAVGVAALFGPSASGKSFLGFDLAAHIADGREWFGHRVTAAPVVYVALEGEAGFKLRAQAWEHSQGLKLPSGLRLVLQGFKLTGDVPELAADILAGVGAGPVVFIDTLNRAAPTLDENSSRDMGEILEGAKELQRLTAGLVVLVHHTGKDAARGLRGHSSLFAALDAAIEVFRDGDSRGWKIAKSKDGADGDSHSFCLDVVQLAVDSDGEPLSSCAVRQLQGKSRQEKVKRPQGKNQNIVFYALTPMLDASTQLGLGGAPAHCHCVQLALALPTAAAALDCDPERRTERAHAAVKGLVASGLLGLGDGWLWRP